MANRSSNDPCNNASDDEELLQPTFSVDGAKDPILTYRQWTLNENAPVREYSLFNAVVSGALQVSDNAKVCSNLFQSTCKICRG